MLMLSLIESLLIIKKIREDTFEPRSEKYSPAAIFERVITIMKHDATGKSNSLAFYAVPAAQFLDFDPDTHPAPTDYDLPEVLYGDETILQIVLLNLLKNAIKFTSHGRVLIIASFNAQMKRLYFRVNDTGKGISQEDLKNLFTKFGKVHRTAEENHEGLGMGLMISQAIVAKSLGLI